MTCEIGQRDRAQIRTVRSTIAGITYRTVNYAVGLYAWHFAEEMRPTAQAFATPPGRAWDVLMVDRETSGDDCPQTIPVEQTCDGRYGREILEVGEGRATGAVPFRDAVRRPIGLVHGGVYA